MIEHGVVDGEEMISALLSDFDKLTPEQRATVDHWIIDDPDKLPPPSDEEQYIKDILNEEQGQ